MKQTYWDNLGREYQFYSTPTLEMIVGFILSNGCCKVFEASSGTGHFIKTLRHAGYRGEFIGSDYCESFLNSSKENNREEEFVLADLSDDLLFGDNQFDISVVHHGLDYVYPYQKAFKELKRISNDFVAITLWQPFIEKNEIRFNEEGKWNVNCYEREEWYETLKNAGYHILVDAEISEWNQKYQKQVYNHLFILHT